MNLADVSTDSARAYETRVRRWYLLVIVGAVALLLGSPIGFVWWWFFPPTWTLRSGWYNRHAGAIIAGTLVPDPAGKVALTDSLRGSMGFDVNTAFVGISAAGSTAIYFPHWQGKGANTSGYVYAPGAPIGSTIKITAPSVPAFARGPLGAPNPPIDIWVEEIIDSNWRLAANRMD